MPPQEHIIRWQAPEYAFHKKSVDWYWWFGLATIGLIALAIYLQNILFAFVIGIGAFSLLLYAIRPPRTFDCEAGTRGIRVGKTLYYHQTIDHFWLKDGDDAEKVILLESRKKLMPIIVLPLGNANIDELRHFLLDFIEEQEIDEPFGQRVMGWLGF